MTVTIQTATEATQVVFIPSDGPGGQRLAKSLRDIQDLLGIEDPKDVAFTTCAKAVMYFSRSRQITPEEGTENKGAKIVLDKAEGRTGAVFYGPVCVSPKLFMSEEPLPLSKKDRSSALNAVTLSIKGSSTEPNSTKKRRGRPPGSKNKPKN